ncbi:hypothetical protein JRI60_43340 [Archangium violaceum]|uniref:hypothetical protein n=1 Tax=Archangium violaceum TaxID=83451 RepID=UPI00194E8613|nr:hypothetical protein [Archangium violaceum]QRN95812.1 hypothetical protein JRI60_43340 [Archangium violaceum]
MSLRSFFLLLLLVPMAAWADIRGLDLYARGEFEKALPVFREEMANPRRTEKERARARIYLAASMYSLGMQVDATSQLEELARLHPEQRVDPNRFPPAFVKLAAQARKTVEAEQLAQAEAKEAEEKRLAEEAEQRRRDAEARRSRPEADVRTPAEPEATASFRLRPEVTGYVDMLGQGSRGFAVGATAGYGALEAGVRLLPGPENHWGVGLELGVLFGKGMLQPRLALRGTGVMGVGVGGGGVVGVRLTPVPLFTLMADVGVEGFKVSDASLYRGVVLVASAGVGFNLF